MKKIASILLIITLTTSLLYSALEYYLIVLQEKEQNWVSKIQNAPESNFKVIKLNATLYTFIEDTDIENVNETVVLNHKVYHVFKRKIKDNILNLYYLGDENQTAIDVSLKDLIKENNSDKNSNPLKKLLKDFSKDYVVHSFEFILKKELFNQKSQFNTENQNVFQGFSILNIPPPKTV